MLKNLYDHFVVLYRDIISQNTALASEHALQQEEEVYKKSTKLTYRNVCIHIFRFTLSSYFLIIGRYHLHRCFETEIIPRLHFSSVCWDRSWDPEA